MDATTQPIYQNPDGIPSMPSLISQLVVLPDLGLVWLSGQVAWNSGGELVGAGDHLKQMAQIVDNLDLALASVGASRQDVLKETIFIVDHDPTKVASLLELLRDGIGDSAPPTSTMVEVAGLFAPGFLVEVEVVARIPHTNSHS